MQVTGFERRMKTKGKLKISMDEWPCLILKGGVTRKAHFPARSCDPKELVYRENSFSICTKRQS